MTEQVQPVSTSEIYVADGEGLADTAPTDTTHTGPVQEQAQQEPSSLLKLSGMESTLKLLPNHSLLISNAPRIRAMFDVSLDSTPRGIPQKSFLESAQAFTYNDNTTSSETTFYRCMQIKTDYVVLNLGTIDTTDPDTWQQ